MDTEISMDEGEIVYNPLVLWAAAPHKSTAGIEVFVAGLQAELLGSMEFHLGSQP